MIKTFIADLENHSVYLVNNGDISFYINVSKEKENTNITLDINTKKKNDIRNLISYFEKIDNYNITLVVPLMQISEDSLEFKKQSNIISMLINTSYKLLCSENIDVNKNINIIKHRSSRSDFIEFFVNIFASRVRYITIDDLVHEEVPYNKVNAANISFVVGKPELDLTIKEEEMKKIVNKTQQQTVEKEKQVVPKANFATSGFVSYYLLGALTAILTLLGLTLLVK